MVELGYDMFFGAVACIAIMIILAIVGWIIYGLGKFLWSGATDLCDEFKSVSRADKHEADRRRSLGY